MDWYLTDGVALNLLFIVFCHFFDWRDLDFKLLKKLFDFGRDLLFLLDISGVFLLIDGRKWTFENLWKGLFWEYFYFFYIAFTNDLCLSIKLEDIKLKLLNISLDLVDNFQSIILHLRKTFHANFGKFYIRKGNRAKNILKMIFVWDCDRLKQIIVGLDTLITVGLFRLCHQVKIGWRWLFAESAFDWLQVYMLIKFCTLHFYFIALLLSKTWLNYGQASLYFIPLIKFNLNTKKDQQKGNWNISIWMIRLYLIFCWCCFIILSSSDLYLIWVHDRIFIC